MISHKKYMEVAIKLAEKGKGYVSPNPLVGCIIVKRGKIVGRGYHKKYGEAHAEINALKAAGKKANNATMYINIEPCSHWGKTGPCTETIVEAGIYAGIRKGWRRKGREKKGGRVKKFFYDFLEVILYISIMFK